MSVQHWQQETGPRRCTKTPGCPGKIISTKRYGEKVFTDKCSECGKVYNEYKVD